MRDWGGGYVQRKNGTGHPTPVSGSMPANRTGSKVRSELSYAHQNLVVGQPNHT